jgi:hypothetical protein
MIAMLALTVVGLGAFCLLLFKFAVYALPAMIGLWAGYWAITSGAGVIGGILVGLAIGGVTLGVGQGALAMARSPLLRLLITALFTIPAALDGYGMTQEIWRLTMQESTWQHVFGIAAGSVTACSAAFKLLGRQSVQPPPNNPAISYRP